MYQITYSPPVRIYGASGDCGAVVVMACDTVQYSCRTCMPPHGLFGKLLQYVRTHLATCSCLSSNIIDGPVYCVYPYGPESAEQVVYLANVKAERDKVA